PSTQAGEFVHEEIEHVKQGKHGARSTKQAIAIGLSKARRAGIDLPAPKGSAATRTKAAQDSAKGREGPHKPSAKRSRATTGALKREGRQAASSPALSQQARSAARARSASSRSSAAKRAVQTKGTQGLQRAARKAARTRASR